MVCGVYIIKNKSNNKPYVGKSKDVEKRWSQHKRKLRNNKHDNDHLQNAFNIYGEDAFSFEIVKECQPEELNDLEKYYIQFYDSMNPERGYNFTEGGEGTLGYKHTEDTKEKMSEAKIGDKNPKYWLGKKGGEHPRYGTQQSEEAKKKISEAHSKYTLWNPTKCHYDKDKMFRKNTDGLNPRRCFLTKYNGKDIPIGLNMDFISCEIIHDLIDDACKK